MKRSKIFWVPGSRLKTTHLPERGEWRNEADDSERVDHKSLSGSKFCSVSPRFAKQKTTKTSIHSLSSPLWLAVVRLRFFFLKLLELQILYCLKIYSPRSWMIEPRTHVSMKQPFVCRRVVSIV